MFKTVKQSIHHKRMAVSGLLVGVGIALSFFYMSESPAEKLTQPLSKNTLLSKVSSSPKTSKAASSVFYQTWQDTTRRRNIPVKIYLPNLSSDTIFPVIIFSHGLGGSREAARYLGEFWASHGYVGVFLQHPGSDESVWKTEAALSGNAKAQNALKAFRQLKAAANSTQSRLRDEDVHFVLDKLSQLNNQSPEAPFFQKLDLSKIGMSGHSFGAATTLSVAGKTHLGQSAQDKRIRAAIALSPGGITFPEAYRHIAIPILHMTGTADDSPINNTQAKDRRVPFDAIMKADQYLLTLNGGDHMVFNGTSPQSKGLTRAKGKIELYPRFQQLIQQSSLLFWDAYLKNDPKAKATLQKFQTQSGNDATFEAKYPKLSLLN